MTAAARNQRLDALLKATQEWATARTTTLNDQVGTLKLILRGRTGSDRLAQTGVDAASGLVSSEVADFLAGV